VGGVIGAGSVALPQMIQNVREGQPLTANIDPAEVGKAAAVGAVAGAVGGATFGLGTQLLGAGWLATGASGAVSGIAGGRSSILANAAWDEYQRWSQGQPLSVRRILDEALNNGLLDKKQMVVDATTGAISVSFGKAAVQILGKTGVLAIERNEPIGPPLIKFLPNGKVYLEYREPIYLPQDRLDKLLAAIAAGNTKFVQEILTQLSDKAVDEVIDNE